MTKPLKYDDSFTSLLSQKINDKFLYVFDIKVQSTAFCSKLNLQYSILVTSIWDIVVGALVVYKSLYTQSFTTLHYMEALFFFFGIFFGLLGVSCTTSLNKYNSRIYKRWRVFITFIFPILEILNNFSFICSFYDQCTGFRVFVSMLAFFLINIYWTKISWSFYIRLEKGHELLVIHGKYLEKMLQDESYKLKDVKKYVPSDHLLGNQKFIRKEDI